MKRIKYTAIVTIIMAILMTFNVFAKPYGLDQFIFTNEVSTLLPPGIKQSKATESAQQRGAFFARADLIISNNGNGEVGAVATSLFRVPVDEAYITIYLDQWDETAERWYQVEYYEAEFYASDYPEGLTTPNINVSFINQKKGCYYRLRGAFGALLDNEYEGFNPVTNGILLD